MSVIHPREDSDGDPIAAASASLDWDNFNESPSFTISGEPHLQQNLQIGDCLKEVESLSEEVQRVTVDQEAIMSFSKPTSKSEMEMEISRENEKLKEMKEHINEMMDDYTEDDVGEGNVELVDRELKEIANARAEFRTSIKEYKKKFGTFHPQNCNTLDGYLAEVNQQIRSHANSIWAKVASIKRNHQPSVLAPGSVSQPSATPQVSSQTTSQVTTSHGATVGDLEYKKSIFKDQLLYLTEALSLPDGGSVEECWKEKTESEVCQAMKELSRWQTSLEKLSASFRSYEKLSKQLGESPEEFENSQEDFENIRNKLKEVSIAVKREDDRRNLQSLLPAKGDKVKYPTFGGEPGEDLVKFKEKMLDCYKKNRIPESDQLDKLREYLKGAALKRVPETIKDIKVAWQN